MRMIHRRFLAVCASLSLMFGQPMVAVAQSAPAAEAPSLQKVCANKRTKGGAIFGALLGAGIGAAAKGDASSILLGAGAGALAGGLIGRAWDKKACQESQKAMDLAMATGETQSWRSADGSKSYRMAVDRRYVGTTAIDKNIATLDGRPLVLTDVAESTGVYTIEAPRVNARDRPDFTKQSKVVDTYMKGADLLVMGQTRTGDWLLVSSRGMSAEGWVKADAVIRTSKDPAAFAASDTRPSRATRVAMNPSCFEGHEEFTVSGKSTSGSAAQFCRNDQGVYVSKDRVATQNNG